MSKIEGVGAGGSGGETVVVDGGPVLTEFNGMEVFVDDLIAGLGKVPCTHKSHSFVPNTDFITENKNIPTYKILTDRILTNDQYFKDAVSWSEEWRCLEEAKKTIEESDDSELLASAYELVVILSSSGVSEATVTDEISKWKDLYEKQKQEKRTKK